MDKPNDEQIIAGRIARDAIKIGIEMCAKGTTGSKLDRRLEEFIKDNGCVPALKGYKPPFTDSTYEHTICLSRNNQAVHGVPHESVVITSDDLITIDLVVAHKGWHADSARTFTFSSDPQKKAMVDKVIAVHTNALSIITPSTSINIYSEFCSKIADEICKVGIVREFCGHGIGRFVHEPPQIPCVPSNENHIFEVGRSYAIEPVISLKKKYSLFVERDGWGVSANCLTAHMEDTIFISNYGIYNLTN